VINDVKFNKLNPHLAITSSDDSYFKVWDLRTLANSLNFAHCYKASEDMVMSSCFSHFNEYLFATGGESSGTIYTWDLRMLKTFLNDMTFHK
jgi:WD40 repeat protein